MAWFKRNLFFAISLLVALLLLAAAGAYDYVGVSDNSAQMDKLKEVYGTLKQNAGVDGYVWGDTNIDNIQIAQAQASQIRDWNTRALAYFKPVMPIPNTPNPTSEQFANALRRTIDQLQHEASDAGVELPPKYGFSFEQQRTNLKYTPASLPPLSVQLGEVKAISEILFAAHVNAFDGIQRMRVSDDDAAGPQADYIGDVSTTNSVALMTPYAVTFRAFSTELASVMAGFANSPNGFLVTGINAAPAGQAAQPAQPGAGPMGLMMPPPVPAPAVGAGRGGLSTGLPTVLNEQLVKVTLKIQIVKLLPSK